MSVRRQYVETGRRLRLARFREYYGLPEVTSLNTCNWASYCSSLTRQLNYLAVVVEAAPRISGAGMLIHGMHALIHEIRAVQALMQSPLSRLYFRDSFVEKVMESRKSYKNLQQNQMHRLTHTIGSRIPFLKGRPSVTV
jgi:hypothetical protein